MYLLYSLCGLYRPKAETTMTRKTVKRPARTQEETSKRPGSLCCISNNIIEYCNYIPLYPSPTFPDHRSALASHASSPTPPPVPPLAFSSEVVLPLQIYFPPHPAIDIIPYHPKPPHQTQTPLFSHHKTTTTNTTTLTILHNPPKTTQHGRLLPPNQAQQRRLHARPRLRHIRLRRFPR